MKPSLQLHSGFKTFLLPFLLIVCAWPGAIMSQALAPYTDGRVDGTGSTARFSNPTGVAVDSAGNVYVAEGPAIYPWKVVEPYHTIRKITPAGVVRTLAGLAGSPGSADGTGAVARFNNPGAVAVDKAGNVYVADTGNNTIRKITPAGVVATLAGAAGSAGSADGTSSAARFNNPGAVAVDKAGNVYVADTGNNTIRKITPAGVVATLAGWAGSAGSADGTGSTARFSSPRGVAVDSAGNVYVADWDNHCVRKITPATVVSTFAGPQGGYDHPFGVAVDSASNVYVSDFFLLVIHKITPAGVESNLYGGAAAVPARRFAEPTGVAVDSAGNIYMAEPINKTIRKITPAGIASTLAGSATTKW
jgi:sugar lactone lactonase YvrE